MKQISKLLLAITLFVFFFSTINISFAQKMSAIPVDLEVPFAPTPVKAEGKTHLLYELHITNFRSKDVELTKIEILNNDAKAKPLAIYQGKELSDLLGRPGTTADLADRQIIGGGLRAVAFLQITMDAKADIPRTLIHRLSFKFSDSADKDTERFVEGENISVQRNEPLVFGSPLRGKGWLAADGFSNDSEHRRALIPVNGKARIAQRFATDWVKLDADGKAFNENPSDNNNWAGYGAEILAVADAIVVDVKDDIPENTPFAEKMAVPITLETIGGNYVILDLGKGNFAFYAHLQPKSIRVKIGDKVRKEQVLGLLGNSGNSDAPHLHFHITNGNSPLGSEGIPFVFNSFEVQGKVNSLESLISGGGWKPNDAQLEKRKNEIPTINTIVNFNEK